MEILQLCYYKDGIDITDKVELTDGKANISGWSSYVLRYNDEKIGRLYCGYPEIEAPGFKAILRTYDVDKDVWDRTESGAPVKALFDSLQPVEVKEYIAERGEQSPTISV